jgi:hypothetical protein
MTRKLSDVADMIQMRISGLTKVESHHQKIVVFLYTPIVHVLRGFSVQLGKKDAAFSAFARLLCEPEKGLDWVSYGLHSGFSSESILREPPDDGMLKLAIDELVNFDKFIRPIDDLCMYLEFATNEEALKLSLNKSGTVFIDTALGDYELARKFLSRFGNGRPAPGSAGSSIYYLYDLRDCLEQRPDDVPDLLNRWEEETVQVLGIEHLWKRKKFTAVDNMR